MVRRPPARAAVVCTVLALLVGGAQAATAHAPIASRFPTPGAKRAVVRTVRIAFRERVLAGTMTVWHEGVKVTPFTMGLVDGGKALQATFTSGLPKGSLQVSWRVRADDGDSEKGTWGFRVTTGDSSHDHG